MQKRIRHHRIHLVAYDALLLQHGCLPVVVPSPSPTPIASVEPLARLPMNAPHIRVLRKTRLIYQVSKTP